MASSTHLESIWLWYLQTWKLAIGDDMANHDAGTVLRAADSAQ